MLSNKQGCHPWEMLVLLLPMVQPLALKVYAFPAVLAVK
jgi:hypothetical protein